MTAPRDRPLPTPAYREHRPHPALAGHVECYWTLSAELGHADREEDVVLPDGCMDVLVSLGDAPTTRHGSGAEPWVVGPMTRPLEVSYGGRVRLVGVRFRPGAAPAYLGAPAAELTDQAVDLGALWGPAARELLDRLGAAGDFEAGCAVLDEVLLARRDGAAGRVDVPVLGAAGAIAERAGRARVDELAERAGLGRRQLERRFLAVVGMPPKVACRVARFRAAVTDLHARPEASLSEVAHAAGYADQAHFTREFRALAGTTPGAYRARRVPG